MIIVLVLLVYSNKSLVSIYTKNVALHTMLLHKWSKFVALKENKTENNYGEKSFEIVLQWVFDQEKDHYSLRRNQDKKHIYQKFLECQKNQFDISKCLKPLADIIVHYEYDLCQEFHKEKFPTNHIYRDIKRLRAYLLNTYEEFGDIYEPNLWEDKEDIIEPEFDETQL